MRVIVRGADDLNNFIAFIVPVSEVTPVKVLKRKIEKHTRVKPENQRLIHKGKQLEDFYTIFDYGVKNDDVLHMMIRSESNAGQTDPCSSSQTDPCSSSSQTDPCSSSSSSVSENRSKDLVIPATSKYFRVGDYVDVRDPKSGAWFEAHIVQIFTNHSPTLYNPEKAQNGSDASNDVFYKTVIKYRGIQTFVEAEFDDIRPVARNKINLSKLKKDDIVLVNYNFDQPNKIGYWYDFRVTEFKTKRGKALIGTLLVGRSKVPFQNTKIHWAEVFEIQEPYLLENRTLADEKIMKTPTNRKCQRIDYCAFCNNHLKKECIQCSCSVCGKKNGPEETIICDDCDKMFHFTCVNPAVDVLPESEWYCPECKTDVNEIVKPGEKLKESKKKTKMVSQHSKPKRSRGSGMANAGRTKECTLVPVNHYGPIPGVEVGQVWLYRIQVSEAGIHRTPVAGIHGRENDGAYSLCLSGDYEDDVDNGNEFWYTGSGGRVLGKEHTGKQSKDQNLTKVNKALALSCAAKFNEMGAVAQNWKEGKPIRVIRNYKLVKYSKYAPEIGNRYDGIYKVVKYFPEKGKSGFTIWRYLLRRDDPDPPPWTPEGKQRIADLGLHIPEAPKGYAMKGDNVTAKSKKRKCSTQDASASSYQKKQKVKVHILSFVEIEIMGYDGRNRSKWQECCPKLHDGKEQFLSAVQQAFQCPICLELVRKPVTTPCAHNMCQICLQKARAANVLTCPFCRADLGEDFVAEINKNLQYLLCRMFPAYDLP